MAASTDTQVTPNRRGARSREVALDAAERVMALHGYEAASLSAIVKESGIPMSSLYHYFGSKDGILLAVMERGAQRFFAALPEVTQLLGDTPEAHLAAMESATRAALEEHPDFLRLLVTLSTQPHSAGTGQEMQAVVDRVRDEALNRLRGQIALAFGRRRNAKVVDELARFALAMIDGAFVATQADPAVKLATITRHVPTALVALNAAHG
jgi:AcrR family transcriptional regulator